MAFETNETGTGEIYVASFPDAGERVRVSAAGGSQAVWRRDGRELFFISARGELMAVPVTAVPALSGGLSIGVPQPLFRVDIKVHVHAQFDTIDGQRFLATKDMKEPGADTITFLSDWFAVARGGTF